MIGLRGSRPACYEAISESINRRERYKWIRGQITGSPSHMNGGICGRCGADISNLRQLNRVLGSDIPDRGILTSCFFFERVSSKEVNLRDRRNRGRVSIPAGNCHIIPEILHGSICYFMFPLLNLLS